MVSESKHEAVADIMHRINRSWLDGRIEDLNDMIHPEIVMVFPGFSGRISGRERFVEGFRDFVENSIIHDVEEHTYQIDITADTAVLTYTYEMVYERGGQRYRSTGRDLWIFCLIEERWLAVWRTMLDVQEHTL